jgi:predicted O-methyltransferase YrrM
MTEKNRLYERALATDGFFAETEAQLLISSIAGSPDDALMLEIGSYKGRSTLFAMSALRHRQRWMVVDSFSERAAYSGHSFWTLDQTLGRSITVIPTTIVEAFAHLRGRQFDLVFVDGDHSLLGVAVDVALSIALLKSGGTLLCHDVSDVFPGVLRFVELLVGAGVLLPDGAVETLARFRVRSRPTWLIDPAPYRDKELLAAGEDPHADN